MRSTTFHKFLLLYLMMQFFCLAANVKNSGQSSLAPEPYDLAFKRSISNLKQGQLTKTQKRNYGIYLQSMEYKIKQGQTDGKLFEFYYKPIVLEVSQVSKFARQQNVKFEERALSLSNEGDSKKAAIYKDIADIYLELAKIYLKMETAFKTHDYNKIETAITEYITCEGKLLLYNVQPPKREWFCVKEARVIQSVLSKNKKKQQ